MTLIHHMYNAAMVPSQYLRMITDIITTVLTYQNDVRWTNQ